MSKDGPTIKSLSERMAEKTAETRREFEQVQAAELQKYAESLRQELQSGLNSINADIRSTAIEADRMKRRLQQWPLWTAAGCATLIAACLITLFTATWWSRQSLTVLRSQVEEETQALDSLKAQTGGVRLLKTKEGSFVSLPEKTNMTQLFQCSGKPCVKLPE